MSQDQDALVAAVRSRTRLGCPPCGHEHPDYLDACAGCLQRWADDRTMDVAFLLRQLDELWGRIGDGLP